MQISAANQDSIVFEQLFTPRHTENHTESIANSSGHACSGTPSLRRVRALHGDESGFSGRCRTGFARLSQEMLDDLYEAQVRGEDHGGGLYGRRRAAWRYDWKCDRREGVGIVSGVNEFRHIQEIREFSVAVLHRVMERELFQVR
jgi:hypothetical protein